MPVFLNVPQFDKQVASRGLTMREFAHECGISDVTITQARKGRSVRPSTLRAMARGLARVKPLPGIEDMDLLITAPRPNATHDNKNDAAAGEATAPRSIANDARHPVQP